MEAREKRKAEKFLKAAGVKARPTQLDLIGQVLGVVLPLKSAPPAELAPAKGIRLIALKDLVPDPNNPRGKVGDVAELVTSIASVGILQPLVVRPFGAPHARGDKFMIVVGHRRFAAAGKAGRRELPCVIRPMTDAQALEVQLIENGQRADLKAIEEADTFARLVAEYAHTPEVIAKRIGKSKAHVLARLKLRALCPEGRKLLELGKLNPSLAVPVARIKDPKAQVRFLARACPDDGPPLHLRAALELLHAEHVRSLKSTPFDQKDADLVPEAGPCTTCPRRSGAVDGLTADLQGHDSCTGPECFDRKAKATWDANVAGLKAKKLEVLSIAKGQALFKHSNALQWDGPFVEAGAPCPDDPKKRTWEKLIGSLPKDKVAIGAERVPRVVAADLKMKPRQLFPRDQALRALSDFGVQWAVTKLEEKTIEGDANESRARFAEERQEREIRNRAAAVIVEKCLDRTPDVKRPEALLMLSLIEDSLQTEERIDEADLAEMQLSSVLRHCYGALLLGLANAWQGYDERLLELAKRHDVDVRMVENAIKRQLADEAAPPIAQAKVRDVEEAITPAGDPVPELPLPTPESIAQPQPEEIDF